MDGMEQLGINLDAYKKLHGKFACLEIKKFPSELSPKETDTHFVYQNRLFRIECDGLLGPNSFILCCGLIKNSDTLINILQSGEGRFCHFNFSSTGFDGSFNTGDTIIDLKSGKRYAIIETYVSNLFPSVNLLPIYCITDSEKYYWISEDDLLHKLQSSAISIHRNNDTYIHNKTFAIAETIVKPYFFIEEATDCLGGKIQYNERIFDIIFNLSGDGMTYGTDRLLFGHGYVPSYFVKWIEDNKIGIRLNGGNGAKYEIKGFELVKFNFDETQLRDYTRHSKACLKNDPMEIPRHILSPYDFKPATYISARVVKSEPLIPSEEAIIHHIGHGNGDALGY